MTEPAPASVLVIGGTGRTGGRIVQRLLQRGITVRILSRHGGQPPVPGIDHIRGDLAAFDPDLLQGTAGVMVSVEPPPDPTGAERLMHQAVAQLAASTAKSDVPVVLVSQIYITRAEDHPEMREVIRARGRGEQALRASGAPYVIVRPGWLTDLPARGVRLEQGDTGEGSISRDTVAEACIQALLTDTARSRTFGIFDADHDSDVENHWVKAFGQLARDADA